MSERMWFARVRITADIEFLFSGPAADRISVEDEGLKLCDKPEKRKLAARTARLLDLVELGETVPNAEPTGRASGGS